MAEYNTDSDQSEIRGKIPHRPPFLWVDAILEIDSDTIVTEKYISPELELFQGHYPGNPILPGVLACEAIFQSGAILISEIQTRDQGKLDPDGATGMPVLTRIRKTKFKRPVYPGSTLHIRVSVSEVIGKAWFLKGKALVDDKLVVITEFGVTIAVVP